MVIAGNPERFSVIFESVEEWNVGTSTSFKNGLLIFCVDCKYFPCEQDIIGATLCVEIPMLIEKLSNTAENESIFSLAKEEAFAKMYRLTYPDDISADNDYRFIISPYCFSDNDYFVFSVRNGNTIRILAADKLSYDKKESVHDYQNASISEVYISADEMNEIAMKLSAHFSQL